MTMQMHSSPGSAVVHGMAAPDRTAVVEMLIAKPPN
jgi:hypothetical protein